LNLNNILVVEFNQMTHDGRFLPMNWQDNQPNNAGIYDLMDLF